MAVTTERRIDTGTPEQAVAAPPPATETFSEDTTAALVRSGAEIFTLRGGTIYEQDHRYSRGHPVKIIGISLVDLVKSTGRSVVAIWPENLYVPGSFGGTLAEQEALMAADSELLHNTSGDDGFELAVPDAPLAVELALKSTWKQKTILSGHRATRTSTEVSGKIPTTASVGYLTRQNGLFVVRSRTDNGYPSVGVMRVAVARPAQNR